MRIARGSNDGWLLNYSFYGNIDSRGPDEVVEALKSTLIVSNNEREVREFWSEFGIYDEYKKHVQDDR